jgi:hypothetical protein
VYVLIKACAGWELDLRPWAALPADAKLAVYSEHDAIIPPGCQLHEAAAGAAAGSLACLMRMSVAAAGRQQPQQGLCGRGEPEDNAGGEFVPGGTAAASNN